jgi:DNA (cytosine-5)-methyltransferase 1
MKLELATDVDGVALPRLVRHLDLFSGIGGFALAAQWVGGIETVAFCEIDPWARRVLNKNFPNVPINGDVKTLNPQDYGRIDLITGGYPCQPFSVAGQRKGANDDRHLWPQVFRILQQARPRWMLCENVAGHIDLGLDEVLSDLASASYSAEAIVVPACALNAIHRRDRVWIIAHADSERGDELLPERVLEEYHASREIKSGGGRFSEAWGHSTRETASRILRTDDGVSAGVDRNRGLGNAIVPQVAAEILRAMMAVNSLLPNLLLTSTSAEYDAD